MAKKNTVPAPPGPGTAGELAELYPAAKRLELRLVWVEGEGEAAQVKARKVAVQVYPFPIHVLGRVARALAPALHALNEAVSLWVFAAEYETETHAAVAEATGLSVEDVALIDGNDFITLLEAIRDANRDFLNRLLDPPASGSQATRMKAANGDGRSASPSSSDTASPTPSA